LPPPEHVPPLSFFPTSTVCSAQSLVGLLHPTADHKVHLVLSRPPTFADIRPSSTCDTLRSVSLFGSGFPVSRAPSLSPLAPHHRSAASPRPQGLVLPSSPLSRDRVATAIRPDAPLGFPRLSAFTAAPWSPSSRSSTEVKVPPAPKCSARRDSLPKITLADDLVTVRTRACFHSRGAEAQYRALTRFSVGPKATLASEGHHRSVQRFRRAPSLCRVGTESLTRGCPAEAEA